MNHFTRSKLVTTDHMRSVFVVKQGFWSQLFQMSRAGQDETYLAQNPPFIPSRNPPILSNVCSSLTMMVVPDTLQLGRDDSYSWERGRRGSSLSSADLFHAGEGQRLQCYFNQLVPRCLKTRLDLEYEPRRYAQGSRFLIPWLATEDCSSPSA